MERMPLISVIVPVYKVEAYLDKCINSIVNQTYTNLEIILVDDGSPDNCPAMCDAWAQKDHRIQVLHKENGGLSDVRNCGMEIASGELMAFVDSDDYISPDMMESLYERMREDNSDIAACGVKILWEDGTEPRMLTRSGSCILDRDAAMEAIICESWLKQPVWYKLYKTELISDIRFPVGKYHEDVFWTYQAVGRAAKVSVFDKPCYFYTQRSGSIMGESYSLRRLDGLEAKVVRIDYIKQNFPQLTNLARRDLWGSCMYSMQMLMIHGTPEVQKQGARIIYHVLKEYPIQCCFVDQGIKQFIWLVMAKVSFSLTCRIRNRLGIGL